MWDNLLKMVTTVDVACGLPITIAAIGAAFTYAEFRWPRRTWPRFAGALITGATALGLIVVLRHLFT